MIFRFTFAIKSSKNMLYPLNDIQRADVDEHVEYLFGKIAYSLSMC